MKCLYMEFLLPVFPIHFLPVLSSPAPKSISLWFLMSPHVDTSPLCKLCCAYLKLLPSASSLKHPPPKHPSLGSLSVSLAAFYSSKIHLPLQKTWVQSLVWEDPTCLGATKPMCPNYWACALEPRKPQLLSLCSATREATTMRSPALTMQWRTVPAWCN